MPTNYTYTGQYSNTDNFGLMFYNARWPALWVRPPTGTLRPGGHHHPLQTQGIQAWDRYAYVNNNPLRYTDPSGYQICLDNGWCGETGTGISSGGGSIGSSTTEKVVTSYRAPSRYSITKFVSLGSFYIPSFSETKIEDDGQPAEDKIGALVNGVAFLVDVLPRPVVIPDDNVFVSMMYEVSGLG
jgi:hypothetical protein